MKEKGIGVHAGARKISLYGGIMQNWSIPTSLREKRAKSDCRFI